jgi:hypothetical protein
MNEEEILATKMDIIFDLFGAENIEMNIWRNKWVIKLKFL